ncbi:hypothetical protein EJ08DRAFT_702570 [Tothia fuscella]|uniref:Uncharacterized protein n=1 Tax=Tothia fuscella TaxID=1048955 RepID=A0A9P4TTN9_9PEZI|nr:hypothetical protein EJ08DRAFT_702570 [Tothia fuscella]
MPITINISSKLAISEIWLSMSQERVYPISGFPRCLFDDERQGSSTREAVTSNPNRWTGNSFRSKAARRAWTTPSMDTVRTEIPMPDLSKPKRFNKILSEIQNTSTTDMSGKSKNGRGQLFRGAFRALLQPIKVKQVQDVGMEVGSNASSYDLDVYRVAKADSEAYHSYLGSLRRSPFTSDDGTPPGNWAASVPGLFEMEATAGGVLDVTGDTRGRSVVEGRIEIGG